MYHENIFSGIHTFRSKHSTRSVEYQHDTGLLRYAASALCVVFSFSLFSHYMLDISSGIDDLGELKWELALCLLLCWIIVFFCLSTGVKSLGKVRISFKYFQLKEQSGRSVCHCEVNCALQGWVPLCPTMDNPKSGKYDVLWKSHCCLSFVYLPA